MIDTVETTGLFFRVIKHFATDNLCHSFFG